MTWNPFNDSGKHLTSFINFFIISSWEFFFLERITCINVVQVFFLHLKKAKNPKKHFSANQMNKKSLKKTADNKAIQRQGDGDTCRITHLNVSASDLVLHI